MLQIAELIRFIKVEYYGAVSVKYCMELIQERRIRLRKDVERISVFSGSAKARYVYQPIYPRRK